MGSGQGVGASCFVRGTQVVHREDSAETGSVCIALTSSKDVLGIDKARFSIWSGSGYSPATSSALHSPPQRTHWALTRQGSQSGPAPGTAPPPPAHCTHLLKGRIGH